jgi:TolA-binding protein
MKMTPLQTAILKYRLSRATALGLVLACLVVWVLINPDNPITNYFSAPIAVRDARIIVGPYPKESDFQLLRKNGVTAIVSLLDPTLPFERVLLDRERVLAAKYGMGFRNIPMSSILTHQFGDDFDRQARLAANVVAHMPGRLYVHCYLGMHRISAVEALLATSGASTGEYLARHGERTPDARLLDEAQSQYDAGDFRKALRSLFNIATKTQASQLLEAWATYRLDDIALARTDFGAILRADPKSSGASLGLGYCALRRGDLHDAASRFSQVLVANPQDESALTGIGLTRYRQGRSAEAARYLHHALAINPGDTDAKAALARIPN